MNATDVNPHHFTKAVTELGDKCPVVTTEAIFNDRGVKILEKGVSVNANLYERLIAHKLPVPIEQSVSSTATITGTVLRARAEQVMQEVPFFERIGADPKHRSLLLDSLEKLTLPEPMAFQLLLANEVRPALFRHSVQMALFAAWMSLTPVVSRYDLGVAAAAGLLHDVGMLHLDPLLLNPEDAITREQRRQLYSHPLVSAVLIERHHEYPRELLRAVNEHHEFLDGSGYPRNLQGDAIGQLGRILSLGELVTAMLESGRDAPEMRLWVQLRMNKHRYDAALVAQVQQHLRPQSELTGEGLELLADPVGRLQEINATVSDWPAPALQALPLSDARREGMAAVQVQAGQLRRTLAAVGVADLQLAQLGGETLDDVLRLELSLLAQEALWQLRALVRQTRRRWRLGEDAAYPGLLQIWLDRADALVDKL
jgi:HD-GYP domain-containing protein (c-di-GMP phosphodiesterase class II)